MYYTSVESMDLTNKKLILERPHKKVYETDDCIIKAFSGEHLKSDVFNEALNQARIEETGLNVPKVLAVEEMDGGWAIVMLKKNGKTLKEIMESDKENTRKYMEMFVDIQLDIHSKSSPLLNRMNLKFSRQINELKDLNATIRYELLTRLDGMKKHTKICHGDFNPSNVLVGENGEVSIIDWSHATQGNAAGDAANTYLLFALTDKELADMYMDIYCEKSDTAKQYVQRWLSIVAAQRLSKHIEAEKELLMQYIDVVDYV